MEVNIIIVAACIPTLRPLFLVIFKRPGATAFLKKSYQATPGSNISGRGTTGSRKRHSRPIDDAESQASINGEGKDIPLMEVTEVTGKESSRNSGDANNPWDTEAQRQEISHSAKRKSGNTVLRTTEIEITVQAQDESERNTRHMV